MTELSSDSMRDVVTLDGPAASGKSTVAQIVARRLGVPFVSSGLLYRAATFLTQRSHVWASDEATVVGMLGHHDVSLVATPSANRVMVDGVDVTDALTSDEVDAGVSWVASLPAVRAWVDARLREIEGSFVIDGRDMGRQVFPDAVAKAYLTARPEVRAARRVGERTADLAAVEAAIRERDLLDVRQSTPADDAVHVDTSDLTIDQVVDRVMEHVEACRNRRG